MNKRNECPLKNGLFFDILNEKRLEAL